MSDTEFEGKKVRCDMPDANGVICIARRALDSKSAAYFNCSTIARHRLMCHCSSDIRRLVEIANNNGSYDEQWMGRTLSSLKIKEATELRALKKRFRARYNHRINDEKMKLANPDQSVTQTALQLEEFLTLDCMIVRDPKGKARKIPSIRELLASKDIAPKVSDEDDRPAQHQLAARILKKLTYTEIMEYYYEETEIIGGSAMLVD